MYGYGDHEDEAEADDGGDADVAPEAVGDDGHLYHGDPHPVQVLRAQVEPAHVVRHEVHDLARRCLVH